MNKVHGRQSTPNKRNRSSSKKNAPENSTDRSTSSVTQHLSTTLTGSDQVPDVSTQTTEDKIDNIIDLTSNGTSVNTLVSILVDTNVAFYRDRWRFTFQGKNIERHIQQKNETNGKTGSYSCHEVRRSTFDHSAFVLINQYLSARVCWMAAHDCFCIACAMLICCASCTAASLKAKKPRFITQLLVIMTSVSHNYFMRYS